MKHPWFKDINFDDLLHKKLLAPVIPNIDNESSVEHFNKFAFNNNELKLSFEIKTSPRTNHSKSIKMDSQALLDFDYLEEDFVETAIMESPNHTRKFFESKKYKDIMHDIYEPIPEENQRSYHNINIHIPKAQDSNSDNESNIPSLSEPGF